jgi:hypothetical protein
VERGRQRQTAEQTERRRLQRRFGSHRVFASHRVILPKGLLTPGFRFRRPGSARLYIEAAPRGRDFWDLFWGYPAANPLSPISFLSDNTLALARALKYHSGQVVG